MIITRKRFRLAAKWNPKTRDLEADCTPRLTNADLRWLFDAVLTNENLAELERRGYDLASLRFHVDKTPEAIERHEETLRGKAQ